MLYSIPLTFGLAFKYPLRQRTPTSLTSVAPRKPSHYRSFIYRFSQLFLFTRGRERRDLRFVSRVEGRVSLSPSILSPFFLSRPCFRLRVYGRRISWGETLYFREARLGRRVVIRNPRYDNYIIGLVETDIRVRCAREINSNGF